MLSAMERLRKMCIAKRAGRSPQTAGHPERPPVETDSRGPTGISNLSAERSLPTPSQEPAVKDREDTYLAIAVSSVVLLIAAAALYILRDAKQPERVIRAAPMFHFLGMDARQ